MPLTTFTSRRDFLSRSFNGLGTIALAAMLADEMKASERPSLMASRPQQLPRKAKNCIFMFMQGGVSQVDTFDYKPELEKYIDRQLPVLPGVSGEIASFLRSHHAVFPSLWPFRQVGQCGRPISTLFPRISEMVDDLAFIYGIKVDDNNHGPATFHINTGGVFPGSPSVGSWITYGLGSSNQNLPGYVVIQDPKGPPNGGPDSWSNGYLPAAYQGTPFRATGTPVLYMDPPEGVGRNEMQTELDLLKWLNLQHMHARGEIASELEARIAAYELAFRMQTDAPEVVDLSNESTVTQEMYGLNQRTTATFGRQCLLARRLVERGVRFTMLTHGGPGTGRWDDHGNTRERMPRHAAEVDQPVAALLQDLKQRGLLNETLVIWASEMGRTPFLSGGGEYEKLGRDHNQYGLVMWMAGGDVKGGSSVGETDEFGIAALERTIHARDVHATILDLMGLEANGLTYSESGVDRRLTTETGANVLTEIIA